MITILTGENSFEIERELQRVIAEFEGAAEMIDGSELELRQLPELLMGATLFASKRLVVIKQLSVNKAIWTALGNYLPQLSDDTHLVLVESKPDKRTKTYKDLQKVATVKELKPWSERDTALAEKWIIQEARQLGYELEVRLAKLLVQRVGVDQWLLFQALQKLAVLEKVTPEIIIDTIDAQPSENVFYLFEAALKGDRRRVAQMLLTLSITEDAYRVFGLLSGQAFQIAALAVSEKSSNEVAKDIGAHPFAVSKLSFYAGALGKQGVRRLIDAFAEADTGMKTSAADPWLLIERALMKVTVLQGN